MNRRQFLCRAGMAATAVVLFPGCLPEQRYHLDWPAIATGVTGFKHQLIERVGQAAIDLKPTDEWRNALPTIDGIKWTSAGLEASIRHQDIIDRLREACSRQYADGNYDIVSYWVLSELEITLCALSRSAA